MEALLNVVWFLITAGAFVASVWLAPRDRRHFLPLWVALLCLSVLLLPIISITDDLHAETFVVEDSFTKQMMSGAGHSSRIIAELGVAIVLVAPLSAILRCTSWRSSEEMFESSPDGPELRLSLDRAPPWLVA